MGIDDGEVVGARKLKVDFPWFDYLCSYVTLGKMINVCFMFLKSILMDIIIPPHGVVTRIKADDPFKTS